MTNLALILFGFVLGLGIAPFFRSSGSRCDHSAIMAVIASNRAQSNEEYRDLKRYIESESKRLDRLAETKGLEALEVAKARDIWRGIAEELLEMGVKAPGQKEKILTRALERYRSRSDGRSIPGGLNEETLRAVKLSEFRRNAQ